ncbi:MAG TPA: PH domain-containing protein [Allosphingosinicella sp.]|nr:PH domain-containing protein [Allosphingosinicella sp.]
MRILDVEAVAPADAPALTPHLVSGEPIHAAFRSPSAAVLFTATRILLVERNALLDEKVETSSFSYRSMRQFSLSEASGAGGRVAIKVWLGADPQPLHLRAGADAELTALQLFLAGMLR